MKQTFFQIFNYSLSDVVFRWQHSNRLPLLLTCVFYELLMYWGWFVLIWLFADELRPVLSFDRVYVFWGICTFFLFSSFALIQYTHKQILSKNRENQLYQTFAVLGVFYIVMIFLINGGDKLYLGVSVVSMSLLFLMLGNTHVAWQSFVAQLATVMSFSLMDFVGVEFPTLYDSKMLIGNEQLGFPIVFLQGSLLVFAMLKAYFTVKILKQILILFDKGRSVLQYQADYDTMTGVKNRRYVMDWLQRHLFDTTSYYYQKYQHEPQDLSVILLDIDFFKRINDTYGHGAGDEVLKEVARRLEKQSHQQEHKSKKRVLVSRYGGEEFLVVMLRTAHDKALKYAEKMRQSLADKPVYINSEDLKIDVTASFGVASLSDAEINALRADLIRYVSKPEDSTFMTPVADQANGTNDQVKKKSLASHTKKSKSQDKAILAEARQQKLRAEFIRQDRSIDNIINMADVALYDAKKMGRNCVISSMQTISIDILLEDGFSLSGSYQPSKA